MLATEARGTADAPYGIGLIVSGRALVSVALWLSPSALGDRQLSYMGRMH